MSERAIDARRERIARAITSCARRLTIEHGLDGFTMDELAECAGVSRRTLFNYVPGKVDAVLGSGSGSDPDLLCRFRKGGPTGHVLTDVIALVREALVAEDTDPIEADAVRRLLRSDPRLLAAVHERFAGIVEEFSQTIVEREGPDTDPIVGRVIAGFTISLLNLALDESLADSRRSLAQHFDNVFNASLALFRGRPA